MAESAPAEVPSPGDAPDATGVVVWHRADLRVADNPAVAAAARRADTVRPLFVFDPAFYDGGLACDARRRFLHECLVDLDDQYAAAGGGLSLAHGDPVAVLEAYRDAGWAVVAARQPTGRYGRRRDDRARERADVLFVAGDGLVRGVDRPREDWQERVTDWFEADPHDPNLDSVEVAAATTPTTVADVEATYEVASEKERVPPGGREAARDRLDVFVDDIRSYPGNISAPGDARDGTSGLSPYLSFGCLSVREAYQYLHEHAADCRGRELFTSRLYWNRHYRQKLADWPGWLDRAVNPELRGFNADRRDADLLDAWKCGRTGYPMVDASMRCLRATGWLNFRMRAMCASLLFHVLQQPWREGADWMYRHLVDADAAINYTQWQSQCGLVGKPTLRVYDPRKQVRDHDPDGEWIREWVPELAGLPATHLDRPERTPLAVQRDRGVRIGEDYPAPVVEYDPAIEAFWRRYDRVKPAAAARLGDEEVALRASLSGGVAGAKRIAAEHGGDGDGTSQAALDRFSDG